MTVTSTVPDTIERSTSIGAPIERVWELISTPGWWINGGTIDLSTIERVTDDRAVVHHPEYGDFEVERFDVAPPTSVKFRWLVGGGESGPNAGAQDEVLHTLVTFTLASDGAGGTRLSVVESGFAAGPVNDEARRRAYDGNSEGWTAELQAAKTFLEGA